jgi:hypothetical protein
MSFELTRIPSKLVTFRPFRTKPNKDGSTSVHYVLALSLNVSDPASIACVEKIAPGIDGLSKRISGEDSEGGELRGRSKLGVVNFKWMDQAGVVLLESPTAKAGQPRINVSRKALETHLLLTLIVHLPREGVAHLHDFYGAQSMVSIATAQQSLLDKKPATTKKKKTVEESYVQAGLGE